MTDPTTPDPIDALLARLEAERAKIQRCADAATVPEVRYADGGMACGFRQAVILTVQHLRGAAARDAYIAAARERQAAAVEPDGPGTPVKIVTVDPRQPAYDAVFAHIGTLAAVLPADTAHRNAMIWKGVQAALDAADNARTAPDNPVASTDAANGPHECSGCPYVPCGSCSPGADATEPNNSPAPDPLRDQCREAVHATSVCEIGRPVSCGGGCADAADAVIAVRDEELTRLRAALARVRAVVDRITVGAPWAASQADIAARLQAALNGDPS